MTLNEAIKIIETNGKLALRVLKNEFRTCSIYQGKENRYVTILNLKTKKTYNVPLPDDEDIKELTMERINVLVNEKFSKK